MQNRQGRNDWKFVHAFYYHIWVKTNNNKTLYYTFWGMCKHSFRWRGLEMLSFPKGTLTCPNTVCLENLSKSLTWDGHRQISLFITVLLTPRKYGCVHYSTSILSLMSSSFLCKIQLNLSPNKGLQLPFTMRVCHSCNTVHRTGAALSNCE